MCRFIKKNLMLTICFVIALVICIIHVFILNNEGGISHTNKWFNLLFQLSIGFIINFIFYLTQIYIPQYKHDKEANKCVGVRVNEVADHMREIFSQLGIIYMGEYDESRVNNEYWLDLLKKINIDDKVRVINPSRFYSASQSEEAHFTVREWILSRVSLVESDIDKIMKYYTPYVTTDLMNAMEQIIRSPMHQNLARSLLHLQTNISFYNMNDDIFLKPYFALMKDLEKIRSQ